MTGNNHKVETIISKIGKITLWLAAIIPCCLMLFVFFSGKEFFPDFFQSSEPTAKPSQATSTLNTTNLLLPIQTKSLSLTTPQQETNKPSTATPTADIVPWQGKYYANTEFREPAAFERSDDALVFDWGESNPAPNMPNDYFTVRWKKCEVFEERYYTFTATTNYYSLVVYVDDNEIMDVRTGTEILDFYMPSGNHCITIDYYHTLYDAYVYFDYAASNKPTSSNSDNPWQGKYYNNKEFREPAAFERSDDTLVFDWGESNPAPNMPNDNFTIRWTKCAEFEERRYKFKATTGYYSLVVYVDGTEIMDVRNKTVDLDYYMPSGNHCIVVEYYHTLYDAYIYFNFE